MARLKIGDTCVSTGGLYARYIGQDKCLGLEDGKYVVEDTGNHHPVGADADAHFPLREAVEAAAATLQYCCIAAFSDMS